MAKSTSTDKVILGATAALLVYEAWTLINSRPKDTISERTWKASAKRPLIPFMLGAIASHFVWQSQDVYDSYREEKP